MIDQILLRTRPLPVLNHTQKLRFFIYTRQTEPLIKYLHGPVLWEHIFEVVQLQEVNVDRLAQLCIVELLAGGEPHSSLLDVANVITLLCLFF